ncbi:hypothetical protein PCH_Pc12g07240 [Penicillium rubens Wisconsin 54-1255]|uniref:Uncharacterized protein n=1 Tax=Penicillium rubens (strain ATCC 28089 / DSM 1075 / NRRL 1951 / Wisconsin 54-1255) TaxID=500485 RepID=B6GWR7_PENRW|nr:hypothetical protein PCH_Pc12g07240 [Penicillium rubens Wisconsin 54-1255]
MATDTKTRIFETGFLTKKPESTSESNTVPNRKRLGKKPVNDLPSIRGPGPCTFEQREKRTHHMQLPAHRGLSRPCLSIPRTFPSGREPNLPIPFHMAVPETYPELGCIRRSGGGKQNEAQDVRSTNVNQILRSQHELPRMLYVVGALKQGWTVRSQIIRQPVLYYPCENATGRGQNSEEYVSPRVIVRGNQFQSSSQINYHRGPTPSDTPQTVQTRAAWATVTGCTQLLVCYMIFKMVPVPTMNVPLVETGSTRYLGF